MEALKALLLEQLVLCKYGNIAFSESSQMTFNERRMILSLLVEMSKKEQEQMGAGIQSPSLPSGALGWAKFNG